MKVIVQNGAHHGLSRHETEQVVQLFPAKWSRVVKSIVLYQGTDKEISVRFYSKSQVVGIFWPSKSAEQPTKSEAVENLLIAVAIIAEHGALPQRMSKSLRSRTLNEIAELLALCMATVAKNAVD